MPARGREARRRNHRSAAWGLCLAGWLVAAAIMPPGPAFADDSATCRSQEVPPDQAIAACDRLIGSGKFRGSNVAGLYLNRGVAWRRKGDSDHALADYNQSLALDSKLGIAYMARANVLTDKGQLLAALADHDTAIRLVKGPDLALAYNNRCGTLRTKGELDRAMPDCDKAIALNPKNSMPYFNRGQIWMSKAQYDSAVADFNKNIELDPKHAEAYNARGVAFDRQGNKDRAIADYASAIALRPGFAIAFRNRALDLSSQGKLDGALADLDQAIRIDPKYFDAYIDRGAAWRSKNALDGKNGYLERAKLDLEESLAAYDQAVALNPKSDAAHNDRGVTLVAKNDLDGALAAYSTAINLNSSNAFAYANRCSVLRRKNDLNGALADCSAAIRLDPGFTAAYSNRGQILESKGDRAGAAADYAKAVDLPVKYSNGQSTHDFAKARLTVLTPDGGKTPGPVAAPTPTATSSGGRLALVIGNGAYPPPRNLANAATDARAIAKALREMGFEVVEGYDLDHAGMIRNLQSFLFKAASARVALMYYAGYGVQIRGENYLVPTDGTGFSEKTADLALINVDKQVLDGLNDDTRANIVMIDAGPLGAPSTGGSLVVFAAALNHEAADGSAHSPFATALLQYIADPNLELVAMLQRVQGAVRTATGGKQNPYVSLPPFGDVYLARDPRRASAN
jgi:tetratricopeptide (TPR) repeat protein